MKKPKIKTWIGSWDERTEYLIGATTQANACKVIGVSLSTFRRHFEQTEKPCEPAASKPEKIYTSPYAEDKWSNL